MTILLSRASAARPGTQNREAQYRDRRVALDPGSSLALTRSLVRDTRGYAGSRPSFLMTGSASSEERKRTSAAAALRSLAFAGVAVA
jgi:hypothetical protein